MTKMFSLADSLERTKLRGKSILGMDAFPTKNELEALFEVASYLEPYVGTGGLNLLPGKVMATVFFEASTRTRLGFESAMQRLGGRIISEATPMITSRITVGETLTDTLKTISKYVHIIGMRHKDADAAYKAVEEGAEVPVITGGFGGREHPVQTCVDLYTMWRTFGRIEGLTVVIPGPEIITSRVSHSLAYGLAKFGAKTIFATESSGKAPDYVREKLKAMNAKVEEVVDLTKDQLDELMGKSDIIYMPAWCRGIPEKEPEKTKFFEWAKKYYIGLGVLEKAREKGKTVYVMHPLPRVEPEMDFNIDKTKNALYWDQVALSLPVRMAMILSVLWGT